MVYLISLHSVIMRCKHEGNKCCGSEVGIHRSGCEDATSAYERNALEAEGFSVILGSCVFSQEDEEEVCDYDHVSFGLEYWVNRISGHT